MRRRLFDAGISAVEQAGNATRRLVPVLIDASCRVFEPSQKMVREIERERKERNSPASPSMPSSSRQW